MPTNVTEFEDDTVFERYVLDRATPLLPTPQSSSVVTLDLGGSTSVAVTPEPIVVRVGVNDSTGSPGSPFGVDDMRPLFFGAAWKVLDLLIELGLELAGVPHDAGRRYTIAFKATQARAGTVPRVPPFTSHPDLWSRLLAVYASTEELRNSLTHRRIVVDQATGEVRGTPKNAGGTTPRAVTKDEQLAFCQAVGGAADSAITGVLPSRRGEQLQWVLDQLALHHGQPSFGVSKAHALIPVVIAKASPNQANELRIDFVDLSQRAHAAVGGVTYYDLQLHLPDGRILAGPLEDAPSTVGTLSLASPPNWLQWA